MKNVYLKKLLPIVIINSVLLTSCSKNSYLTNNLINSDGSNSKSESLTSSSLTLSKWQQLTTNTEKTNYSLANLLANDVAQSDKENVKRFIESQLSNEDAKEILENIENSNIEKRKELLYYNAPWIGDGKLIQNSLMNSEEIVTSESNNFENQLKLSVAFSIQRKTLKSILDIYESDANKAAEEIVPDVIEQISELDKKEIEVEIANNNKNTALDKIKQAVLKLDQFNQIKKDANITLSQTAELAITGIIAYKIYDQIKDTKTFANIKKIVQDAKTINEKRKELLVLGNAITSSFENMRAEFKDLKSSTNEINSNTSDIIKTLKKDVSTFSTNDRSINQQISFMYDKFYKNKDKLSEGENNKYYSDKFENISKNINHASNNIENMSHNLDNIISSVTSATNLLGIKLGKDAIAVLDTAKKASKVMSVVSSTLKSFTSGGFLGAGSALLGQSMNLFGGGADQTATMLQEMDKKLDQVIDLQKQTIQLQLDTMKMIKNLAQMVDEYHQDEMKSLYDIRSNLLVNLELSKTELNSDIRKCERLISFQLSKVNSATSSRSQIYDSNIISLTQKAFYGSDKSYANLKSIIRSTEFNGFNDCQSGINEAFGTLSISENPILGLYSSTDGSDMKKFQDETYLPLENFLVKNIQDKIGNQREFSTDLIALHLPTKKFEDLHTKFDHLDYPAQSSEQKEVYDLEHFISTTALQRYATSLLILYPLIDVDKETWENGALAVINRFFEDITDDNQSTSNKHYSRSFYLLNNALYLTRSAIAQEAILSGEPLLKKIYQNQKSLFSKNDTSPFAKAISNNSLLLKNYIAYSILLGDRGVYNFTNYSKAIKSEDTNEIKKAILNASGIDGEVSLKDKVATLKLSNQTEIILPTIDQLNADEIFYSQNMIKLIKLENKIIDALVQVLPNYNSEIDSNSMTEKYQALILNNAL
jgi:hypothetical protein